MFGDHNHIASASEVGVAICKNDIKDAALVSRAKPRQIIGQAMQGLDEEGLAMVGRPSSLARTVQRYQRKYLPEPTSIEKLVIPPEWTTTGGAEPRPFLIYDAGGIQDRRVLIFASDECLWVLSRANIWFMDGNF